MARKFVISQSVANLRKDPLEIPNSDFSNQGNRETQLLYGEELELIEEQGEWIKISALEQLCYDETQGWHPYYGWVRKTEIEEVDAFAKVKTVVCAPFVLFNGTMVSYGTFLPEDTQENSNLRAIPTTPCRFALVEEARRFIGAPYLWGGRSFPLKDLITSVDCSGLINLLYRAQGILIPRNAHAQYLKAKPTTQLQPGDPLYLAKEKTISHVLLKLDDQTFMESPETGKCIRTLTLGEQIWEQDGKIHIFDRPSSYRTFPSTFLS